MTHDPKRPRRLFPAKTPSSETKSTSVKPKTPTAIASAAVSKAVGQLNTAQQTKLRRLSRSAVVKPGSEAPVVSGARKAVAVATNPIKFFTNADGTLAAPNIEGTARHEVGHHLLTATSGRTVNQHSAMLITRVKDETSGAGLRQLPLIGKLPFQKRITTRLKRTNLELPKSKRVVPSKGVFRDASGTRVKTTSTASGLGGGSGVFSKRPAARFTGPHNRAVTESTRTSKKSLQRARDQALKLGRRLKGKIDF